MRSKSNSKPSLRVEAILDEPTPEITISRDTQIHRWIVVMGSHHYATPFIDTTSPDRVIRTLRHKAAGDLRVLVNL